MCYMCSHYKRQKRETILNLGIETETVKEETKPEIKDEPIAKPAQIFRDEIYHWILKSEAGTVHP